MPYLPKICSAFSTCLFQLKLMASLQSQMACVIPGSKDLVLYLGTGSFSSQKAYTHMKGHREVHAPFKWIWKSSYLKHKIFLQLICKDRLNIICKLRRQNMHLEYYSCVFCANAEDETIDNLFSQCPSAQDCGVLLIFWSCLPGHPLQPLNTQKEQLAIPFFMKVIIILFSWSIWITKSSWSIWEHHPFLDCPPRILNDFT